MITAPAVPARRESRGYGRAAAAYQRHLTRLPVDRARWADQLDALAAAAAMVADRSAGEGAEMWALRAELIRCAAAAHRGGVQVRVRYSPAPWENRDCLTMWQQLARSASDTEAAGILDALFRRLAWSLVPDVVTRAALVLADLAAAMRPAFPPRPAR